MSIEPHHLATSAAPFSAAVTEYAARGWAVQRSVVGRREIAVVTGTMGVVIVGEDGVESRSLHTRAGEVCAALPAALRRHVLVVEPGEQVDLAGLPAVLTADQADLAATVLVGRAETDGLTVAKVLEWTRHAQPEPARAARRSRLDGPAAWLTRHAVIFAVIALGAAMLSIVGLGGYTGNSTMVEAQTTSSSSATPAPAADDKQQHDPTP